jgi:hypothetical protein
LLGCRAIRKDPGQAGRSDSGSAHRESSLDGSYGTSCGGGSGRPAPSPGSLRPAVRRSRCLRGVARPVETVRTHRARMRTAPGGCDNTRVRRLPPVTRTRQLAGAWFITAAWTSHDAPDPRATLQGSATPCRSSEGPSKASGGTFVTVVLTAKTLHYRGDHGPASVSRVCLTFRCSGRTPPRSSTNYRRTD